MKGELGCRCIALLFHLTLALDGGGLLSRPGHFKSKGKGKVHV